MKFFKKVKTFLIDHKEEIITATVAIIGGALFFKGIVYMANSPHRSAEGKVPVDDMPIPDFGTGFDIQENWDERNECVMIVDAFLPHMGEFGEKMINELDCNPDIPVSMVVEYVPNWKLGTMPTSWDEHQEYLKSINC